MEQTTHSVETMIRTWTDSYRTIWETWLNAMEQLRTSPQSGEAWQRSVELWEKAVHQTLESNQVWLTFWAEQMANRSNVSTEMSAWGERVHEMTHTWRDAQTRLVNDWVVTLQKTSPATITMAWSNTEAHQVMQTWQDASQRLLEAQISWLQLWTPIQVYQNRETGTAMDAHPEEVLLAQRQEVGA